MIDSHTHLNHHRFASDLQAALDRARTAGVDAMLLPGYDLESSRQAVALAEAHGHIYAAVGIHPHDAQTLDDHALEELARLAAHPRVVAIGEIGLDFYRDLSPRELQVEAFRRQIRLARQLSLPIIIHHRDAGPATPEIVEQENASAVGGVWHCFSGDEELADFALSSGFYIGLAGPITFRNNHALVALAARLPADRLLIETDAPYLAPHPHRGSRNEPAYLPLVARALAGVRRASFAAVAAATRENFTRLFLKERD